MTHEEKAEMLFMSGHNCAQSVFGAYADDFGIGEEIAAKLSCGLGGGVGGQHEVCGTVTAAALVLGLKYGPDKMSVYPKVQDFAARFKAECGSVVCRELLSGAFGKKRPCGELVKLAARLLEQL